MFAKIPENVVSQQTNGSWHDFRIQIEHFFLFQPVQMAYIIIYSCTSFDCKMISACDTHKHPFTGAISFEWRRCDAFVRLRMYRYMTRIRWVCLHVSDCAKMLYSTTNDDGTDASCESFFIRRFILCGKDSVHFYI